MPLTDNPSVINAGPYCTYERKKQLTAFLLQFFIFSGAGQFYVGNLQYAIPQLIITFIPCFLSCLLCCCLRKDSSEGTRTCMGTFVCIITSLFSCTFFAWWLADVIIFGMNKYLDGNGIPLKDW
jgi:uncharacterized membrane protein AbrB (regulator of aidB expression)